MRVSPRTAAAGQKMSPVRWASALGELYQNSLLRIGRFRHETCHHQGRRKS